MLKNKSILFCKNSIEIYVNRRYNPIIDNLHILNNKGDLL